MLSSPLVESLRRRNPNRPFTQMLLPLGSGVTQPTALISHGAPDLRDNYDEQVELLRQFDLNMSYGLCLGITRLTRLERACSLGMNPPKEVESLLKGGNACLDCLWDGLMELLLY